MKTLGIRKETKNKWERRVPLNPEAVKNLIEKGFKVIVQPSEIRIYKDEDYEKAGAIISENLANCDLILGVKEVPVNEVEPGIPHLFFSHTIKGQDYNMPLLQKFLETKTTLIDYEKIVDANGRRLVFFGKFAGNAGMVDTLYGLGQRLFQEFGIKTPFLKVKQSYQYESVADAVEHLKKIGKEIEENGLPEEITPLNIFLLGYGHVSKGCQEILAALPIVEIDPDELENHQKNYANNKIYLSIFKEKHLVERKDGSPFDLQHYFRHCSEYKSKFDKYLPYCSVYMNAIYWDPNCPVFLTKEKLAEMQKNNPKLIIIGDITCDINGSVQATVKATEPDNPIYIFNALTGEIKDGFVGEGFADMAVDNLPCEFSKEASDYFSDSLMPFMEKMLLNDYSKSIEESDLPAEIKHAVIAHQGKLRPEYEYLKEYLKILKK
ncbi:MAG: hypothetical protein DRZ79_05435 [Candidatus Cloacimonadota bacterium]|nr:MAG: hypothetical protein DRZ79_05435 [Candidatus Cloacimonadota bacterium]